MHILAWIVVSSAIILYVYDNYTEVGKWARIRRPTTTKPFYNYLFIGSVVYLFYYYFGV